MSRLEELIRELCPNGVEFKKIKDTASLLRGKRLTKDQLNENYRYPVFHGGLEPLGFYMKNNRDAHTVMIINVGASAGTVGFCDTDFWSSDGCFCLSKSTSINSKYLYYTLIANERFLMSKVRRAGIPTLDSKVIEELKIPVPPLEVQREIVRILDDFTEKTEELKEKLSVELTARKKQYEYYRDELLDNANNVRSLALGDIAKIKNGKDYKSLNSGTIPVYGSGGVMTYVDEYAYNKPTVLIPRKGSVDKLYYVETPFWNVDTIFYTDINVDIIIPKYLFYLLQKEHLEQYNTAGGVPSLTQGVLNKVQLLVPSIDEQKRIVDILDRFDTIYNDISVGLPAEIEARQKQYEYYRDKLLSFEQIEN